MCTFDVQSIELDASPADAFRYLANPAALPEWTHAFKAADSRQATMSTPEGAVQVGLRVDASEEHGTIDWTTTFPTGVIAKAHSRVTPHRGNRSIYTFVLEAPPAPLEALEGVLAEQSRSSRRNSRGWRRAWRQPVRGQLAWSDDLASLVAQARDGHRDSLEDLVVRIERPVYKPGAPDAQASGGRTRRLAAHPPPRRHPPERVPR